MGMGECRNTGDWEWWTVVMVDCDSSGLWESQTEEKAGSWEWRRVGFVSEA